MSAKKTTTQSILMHDQTELLRGDPASITIIYRNLTRQNPVSSGYIDMMNEEFGITIEPSKLRIEETR